MKKNRVKAFAACLLVALVGCAPPPNLPAPQFAPAPDVGEVESVIFLIGDPGDVPIGTSPVLAKLKEDVAWWSERLDGEAPVKVVVLGDIVYPLGLHPPDHPDFPHDSLVVMGQVDVFTSPAALEKAEGYFMSGNHDWGLEDEWEGFVRILNLAEFLERARERTGANVRFIPDPGTGGPYVIDVGQHVRVLGLDTAWWILDGGQLGLDARDEVLAQTRAAIESAGDREIVIVGHHPFQSAGPHGGEFSFWRSLGVRYLLVRSGAMLQDITSIPYRELSDGLRSVFAATKAPLLFAGGHEHSLQVFRGLQPMDPRFSVVSGSGSKLSGVGFRPGMQFGRPAPGYMTLVIERDADMTLLVEATGEEYLKCPLEDPARSECMAQGLAAFETVHSQQLN